MTAPSIPDAVPVDLTNGISGVMFAYVTSYPHLDTKRTMSELLYLGLEGFCRELYGLGVRTIIHQGIYNARTVRNGNDWSNHAFALAIDLYSFVFENGTVVPVSSWKKTHRVDIIEKIWGVAERYFSEVITPADNKLHADHIHAGYSGKHYARERAKWEATWKATGELYTAEEKAIANEILHKGIWAGYIGKDGDPGTKVRNIYTHWAKGHFKLE